MSNHLSEQQRDELHAKVLHAAALLFVEKGYAAATTRELASRAGVQVSAMNRAFGSKEHILSELVHYILNGHFSVAKKMLADKTNDKVLFYAVEAALQFYMAECNEAIRDLYCTAYSLSETSELVLKSAAENMIFTTFAAYLPDYTQEDFYQLEIASGSIVRGYMMTKCTEDFTIEKKVSRFLEAALRIYRVPEEKIQETIEYMKRFDFRAIAEQTIRDMLTFLNK